MQRGASAAIVGDPALSPGATLSGGELRPSENRRKIHSTSDLSPNIHPAIGGILWSFEPVWLGDAMGRDAEPST
jgi:hypothetical protein